jgi:putative hydrolase of the HAD superfamily
MQTLRLPKAILFDLFHTLVCVPPPAVAGEISVPEILGVPSDEWQRRYYDEDIFGRCLGHVRDSFEAMRLVTHSIDSTVDERKISEAVASRRRRFEAGLVNVEEPILAALDQLRGAGIRTAIVSDAGADDVESWPHSPLRSRFDVTVFSYEIGLRKPDPRIYLHALSAVGVSPQEAMFVGDGGSQEHAGARALGITAVLVTRLFSLWWPEKIADRRPHADCEFQDVPALVQALGLAKDTKRITAH